LQLQIFANNSTINLDLKVNLPNNYPKIFLTNYFRYQPDEEIDRKHSRDVDGDGLKQDSDKRSWCSRAFFPKTNFPTKASGDLVYSCTMVIGKQTNSDSNAIL